MCIRDRGSTVELYAGYGKNIVTALATINGSAVGILATEKAALCHKCTAKAARFVRPVSYTHLDVYKRQLCGSA